ncbi:hypothetical protein [Agrobacterium sp. NPDC090273]
MFTISPIITNSPAGNEVRVLQTIVGVCAAALLTASYAVAAFYF